MALEWKTIPYSDEVAAAVHDHAADYAPIAHDHVEADITDLSHDAIALQGNAVSNATPSDGDALLWNATGSTWEPGEVVGSGAHDHDLTYAPIAHDHVEADITDLSHDATSL